MTQSLTPQGDGLIQGRRADGHRSIGKVGRYHFRARLNPKGGPEGSLFKNHEGVRDHDEKIAHVEPDAGIKKCMGLMGKHRVRHLPVDDKGKVIGVITSTDVLILTVHEKNNITEQLVR